MQKRFADWQLIGTYLSRNYATLGLINLTAAVFQFQIYRRRYLSFSLLIRCSSLCKIYFVKVLVLTACQGSVDEERKR